MVNITFGNKESEGVNKSVECRFSINERIYSVEKLYVVDKLAADIILGNEFLSDNNIIIDFSRRIIVWDKKSIKFAKCENEDEDKDELDDIFYNKVLNLSIETKDILNDYKKVNSGFESMDVDPIKIVVDQNFDIKKCKYYSLPESLKDRAKEEIRRLLSEGIIEDSKESFASPTFFVNKKNGAIRLVVDYSELNKYIKDDIHVIPRIEDIFHSIGQAGIISKLDLTNGFNQLKLDENSKRFTTFSLLGRKFQYKRLPFGIKIGPKVFQGVLNHVLKDIDNVSIYIDDIIIATKTKEQHEIILKTVLERLKKFKVKINFDKSEIMRGDLEILGTRITNGELLPNIKSLHIFEDLQVKKKKDLQKILGLLNWYRKFVPNLSTKLISLTDKLQINEGEIKLSNEDLTNIKEIIENIKNNKLVLPDYTQKFILQCDASNEGLGGVLLQKHGVIQYISKKFNKTEKNYSIVEKEMFSIAYSLQKCRNVVLGNYIEIFTDSRNCLFDSELSPRMARWRILINEYNYDLKSIEGRDNNMADIISRCKIINCSKNFKVTSNDYFLRKIDKFVLKRHSKNTGDDTNLISTWMKDKKGRVIIIESKVLDFVKFIHEHSVHAGMLVTFYNLIKYFKCYKLKRAIKNVVKNCENCIVNKKQSNRTLKEEITSDKLFNKISMDIFDPFKLEKFKHDTTCEKGYIY